jgi:hypothetical protein
MVASKAEQKPAGSSGALNGPLGGPPSAARSLASMMGSVAGSGNSRSLAAVMQAMCESGSMAQLHSESADDSGCGAQWATAADAAAAVMAASHVTNCGGGWDDSMGGMHSHNSWGEEGDVTVGSWDACAPHDTWGWAGGAPELHTHAQPQPQMQQLGGWDSGALLGLDNEAAAAFGSSWGGAASAPQLTGMPAGGYMLIGSPGAPQYGHMMNMGAGGVAEEEVARNRARNRGFGGRVPDDTREYEWDDLAPVVRRQITRLVARCRPHVKVRCWVNCWTDTVPD